MKNSRAALVMILICGIVSGGCQSNSGSMTVTEYRPKQPLTERKAPSSEVFVLVRWTPIAPLTTVAASPATTRPVLKQMPVEVEEVYVPRGRTLGFRRNDGQLIAIADADSKPLEEAHYEWKTLPGHPGSQAQESSRRFDQIVSTVACVTVLVGLVVLVLWVVHDDRHSLLDDVFNDGN